jgi:hypothetical protein
MSGRGYCKVSGEKAVETGHHLLASASARNSVRELRDALGT